MNSIDNPPSEFRKQRPSGADTLADARWFGSSLDCRAPTPRLGSWVWKTDMRPPVGDSSLKAACRAEPRADWVSIVFWNRVGRLFSRSCTSWKTQLNVLENSRLEGHSQDQQIQSCCHVQHRGRKCLHFCIDDFKLPTSLHSLRLTRRLSGVGKKISVAQTDKNTRVTQMLFIYFATDTNIRTCGLCGQLLIFSVSLTFDVRHDQHLGLRKSLLEVVEVDGAVEGDEADLCPRITRKPETL